MKQQQHAPDPLRQVTVAYVAQVADEPWELLFGEPDDAVWGWATELLCDRLLESPGDQTLSARLRRERCLVQDKMFRGDWSPQANGRR